MSLQFIHTKGDTFDEVPFSIKRNNVALNLTGATIKMQLRNNYSNPVAALSLTSVGSAGITITNAAGGIFKINSQIIDIDVYNYVYDIEITLSTGERKTWIKGGVIITNEVTK